MTERITLGGKKRGRPKTPEDIKLYRKVRDLMTQVVHALSKPESVASRAQLDLGNTADRMARRMVYEALDYPDVSTLKLTPYAVPERYVCAKVEGPVAFASTCAHHGLPFHGDVYVGLLPGDYLLSPNDYVRAVECLSRRYQLQEKLGCDILDVLVETLNPIAAVVRIVTRHGCIACRGARSRSTIVTSHVWPIDTSAAPVLQEINNLMETINE